MTMLPWIFTHDGYDVQGSALDGWHIMRRADGECLASYYDCADAHEALRRWRAQQEEG
jgi:hypothetical protein